MRQQDRMPQINETALTRTRQDTCSPMTTGGGGASDSTRVLESGTSNDNTGVTHGYRYQLQESWMTTVGVILPSLAAKMRNRSAGHGWRTRADSS
jgi:hypothetical protein